MEIFCEDHQDHLLWMVVIPPVFGGVHILQHMYDFDFLKMNYKADYVAWWQNSLLACSKLWVQPPVAHTAKKKDSWGGWFFIFSLPIFWTPMLKVYLNI